MKKNSVSAKEKDKFILESLNDKEGMVERNLTYKEVKKIVQKIFLLKSK